MKKLLVLALGVLALSGCSQQNYKDYQVKNDETLLVGTDIYTTNYISNGYFDKTFNRYSITYRVFNDVDNMVVFVNRTEPSAWENKQFTNVQFQFSYLNVKWSIEKSK